MENITPILKQYQKIKSNYPDCILFFRLGDFYEMFYEDARKASSLLELVLTSRAAGKSGRVPMCGLPYHAADNYIRRLIKAGLKVAICEQVEDVSKAVGIVKREVIRVITSGTFIDENSSDSRYLLSLAPGKEEVGIAFIDVGSGTIQTNQYSDKQKAIEVIYRLSVYECLFPLCEEEFVKELFNHPLLKLKKVTLSPYEDWCFNSDIARKSLCEHFHTHSLRGFGIEDLPAAVASAGALLEYLKKMSRQPMLHVDKISLYADADYVFISPFACHGLELEKLVKIVNKTLTPMGKRLLKQWVYHPLKDVQKIVRRQKAVKLLKENISVQEDISRLFRNIPDIEKSVSRISCGYSTSRDLLALRNVFSLLPEMQKVLHPLAQKNELFQIKDIPDLRKLLIDAINPEVPVTHPEGKVIKNGYNSEIDILRDLQENGRQGLKSLQMEERKKTGINSLKIGYNKVFGYYIEVTKPNLSLVPPDYIRKQTLVNAERFITQGLKEFEEEMLTAEEKLFAVEMKIIKEIQEEILKNSYAIHSLSSNIAKLDTLYSISLLALSPGYTLPEIKENLEISIKGGRHPVVEENIDESFVPNDVLLDCDKNQLLIITGPNMAGKSTYIRQVALLVIMAQMGSFIPADSACIGIVDKIFTRIGAQDEISKGQSTFMVEMSETADILNNLTGRSLLILDEIGRGTSTYDGLSLAWAVAEYLHKRKVRTLFATHFHELTGLAEENPGTKNYNVAVEEWESKIIFLHKITPGGTDESYGIYVAKLAGIPEKVISRAQQILIQLEIQGVLEEKIRARTAGEKEVSLFQHNADYVVKKVKKEFRVIDKIKEEIMSIDINATLPLEALNKIQEWKNKINKKNGKSKSSSG